jgi:hypothetical protein
MVQHEAAQNSLCMFLQVLVKGDLRMDEAIAQHMTAASADLLVMGSHNLCAAGKHTAEAAAIHYQPATRCTAMAGGTPVKHKGPEHQLVCRKPMVQLQWYCCHSCGCFRVLNSALQLDHRLALLSSSLHPHLSTSSVLVAHDVVWSVCCWMQAPVMTLCQPLARSP